MTIFIKEIRQSFKALCIWTASLVFLLAVCIFMFPEMKNDMDSVSNMFANMGAFSAAFGMDKLNFGELMGFYAVECGNMMGIGGAMFAAIIGISALCDEENKKTAEFLLTHPVSRSRVVLQKLLSVILQITILNTLCVVITLICAAIIGESFEMKQFLLLHLAFYIMQLEIAFICFAISAFLSRGGMGIGIGAALAFYFMNLIANMTDKAEFLKYITPFSYAEASDIITDSRINITYLIIGIVISVISIILAFVKYNKKDIQ